MQYASEWRIPAGRSNTGNGATSRSNDSIVRNVGVVRRDWRILASRPRWKRVSSSSDSTSSSPGITPYWRRSSRNRPSASRAGAESSANPLSSSCTTSPPFDHTNGATRMIDGSTPRP